MTESPGALMAAEIAEQPAVLARRLTDLADLDAARERLGAARPRFVLIAARGTSDHAALYAKYLVEVRLGLPAGLVSPSAYTVHGARPDLHDVLFVAVSQSGGSPDLLDSLAVARECGALTLAVTNAPGSPLASAAELSVDVAAGAERAVAATKTYTAELLTLQLLLSGADAARDAAGVPDAAARRSVNLRDEPRCKSATLPNDQTRNVADSPGGPRATCAGPNHNLCAATGRVRAHYQLHHLRARGKLLALGRNRSHRPELADLQCVLVGRRLLSRRYLPL